MRMSGATSTRRYLREEGNTPLLSPTNTPHIHQPTFPHTHTNLSTQTTPEYTHGNMMYTITAINTTTNRRPPSTHKVHPAPPVVLIHPRHTPAHTTNKPPYNTAEDPQNNTSHDNTTPRSKHPRDTHPTLLQTTSPPKPTNEHSPTLDPHHPTKHPTPDLTSTNKTHHHPHKNTPTNTNTNQTTRAASAISKSQQEPPATQHPTHQSRTPIYYTHHNLLPPNQTATQHTFRPIRVPTAPYPPTKLNTTNPTYPTAPPHNTNNQNTTPRPPVHPQPNTPNTKHHNHHSRSIVPTNTTTTRPDSFASFARGPTHPGAPSLTVDSTGHAGFSCYSTRLAHRGSSVPFLNERTGLSHIMTEHHAYHLGAEHREEKDKGGARTEYCIDLNYTGKPTRRQLLTSATVRSPPPYRYPTLLRYKRTSRNHRRSDPMPPKNHTFFTSPLSPFSHERTTSYPRPRAPYSARDRRLAARAQVTGLHGPAWGFSRTTLLTFFPKRKIQILRAEVYTLPTSSSF
ncbi:hypothetical protein C7M84_005340 [Penaeus vannamei]|uniref:Uncharacterized protein n=1 Tax=Penaeus vannamei TaxID=6689 RepID=A0A423TI24_PENVA|nr:hypothetical protein C7M84_005340 [Penaeus vannamei]